MSFIHLHVHSHFSLLDGLSKIDGLVKKATEYAMPSLALTDHGVMYGTIEFYQKAKKAGIKPIIGVEAYIARNKHTDKRPNIDTKPYHFILLAKDETGYRNLIKLTTIAHLDGFYYKPRIDLELLERYHEGLIGLSACLAGEVASTIMNGNPDGTLQAIERYQQILGKENFYLEVQHHPHIEQQGIVNEKVFAVAQHLSIPVVATVDTHYLAEDDNIAQDALVCIQTKKNLTDKDRLSMIGEDFSFRSIDQLKEDWATHPEVLNTSVEIAERCNVSLSLGASVLPYFAVPDKKTPETYLGELCEQGLVKRYGTHQVSAEIRERLAYELSIIEKTGFASYFLIVADFINWAKNNGIVVGPGRGSAAGSLVAYLMGITNIDPLTYNLLFERFLNPERISMPDIDTDFADTRRDEVLQYVANKYGHDHVAQIITFGTMAARAAIRDVGRVMGLPYTYCDRVAKLIPPFSTLSAALKSVPELQQVMTEADGRRLIEISKRLEGCARHASTHACGVVISAEPLDHYVPLQRSNQNEEEIISQYEMHAVETLGLLKIDFLGLKNLTMIENTLEILKKARGIDIDIDTIPLDDPATFKLLQRAETTGVFQLESSGMKRYLRQLKSTELEDIIAMVALYRPGPMELIPDYIAGKHGLKRVTYLDPRLEPILEKTYGIAVYQEQLMEIARKLAGFSYGEADVLRKAVGKKISELLKEQEEKMIAGMMKNGIKQGIAQKIWDYILPFARYGFNRSHAACYALIAYQTAYLKAQYPAEFMASLLTVDHGNMDRVAIEVEECRQMDLAVLPPDINESFSTFTVVYDSLELRPDKKSQTIRFGLSAVKNLGDNVIKEIIKERRSSGAYTTIEDLLSRVKTKDLNKKSLEALIKSGALDQLGERNQLLYNIDKLLAFVKNVNQEADSGQSSLFGMMATDVALPKLTLEPMEGATDKQKLTWEKELLGLYVSAHPMHEYQTVLRGNVTPIADVIASQEMLGSQSLRVAGVVTKVKRVVTRNGDGMAFARIEDATNGIEVLIFPRTLQEDPALWVEDKVIMMNGRLSDKDGEVKLICNQAREITPESAAAILGELIRLESAAPTQRFSRTFNRPAAAEELLVIGTAYVMVPAGIDPVITEQLKQLFVNHPGKYKACLILKTGSAAKRIATQYMISGDRQFKEAVEALVGVNSFHLESAA